MRTEASAAAAGRKARVPLPAGKAPREKGLCSCAPTGAQLSRWCYSGLVGRANRNRVESCDPHGTSVNRVAVSASTSLLLSYPRATAVKTSQHAFVSYLLVWPRTGPLVGVLAPQPVGCLIHYPPAHPALARNGQPG